MKNLAYQNLAYRPDLFLHVRNQEKKIGTRENFTPIAKLYLHSKTQKKQPLRQDFILGAVQKGQNFWEFLEKAP